MTAVAHAAAAFACAIITLAMTATTNASTEPTHEIFHQGVQKGTHQHRSAHSRRHMARHAHHILARRAAHHRGRSSAAGARVRTHVSASAPRHAGAATVCSSAGCSRVVPWAKERFQGLIRELQDMGYAVGHPGCLGSGHMRHSKHHWGGACDLFDQVARDRTRLRQPPPAVQIAVAARHGLRSGCAWHDRDCGHFEVPTQYAGRRAGRRYASRQ